MKESELADADYDDIAKALKENLKKAAVFILFIEETDDEFITTIGGDIPDHIFLQLPFIMNRIAGDMAQAMKKYQLKQQTGVKKDEPTNYTH